MVEDPPRNPYRTYAVAVFGVTTPRFLPAAAWYVPTLCVRFFRATRGKTAHDWKGAHRSAEGTTRQLRKSYLISPVQGDFVALYG